VRRDIQLKGSGPTPFSRQGDGRAALGPVLREYIVSEAMAALGIPTTRALAAVTTGEAVWRETPLPGAVLTRVAAGHTRIGTFQFFTSREETGTLQQLADYVIARHCSAVREAANPYRAFLERIGRIVRPGSAGRLGLEECDDSMKFRSSSSGCETCPARGEPARAGSEPCDGLGNGAGEA
jgi:uncharacterized protein YdiU (UPF0061 family)